MAEISSQGQEIAGSSKEAREFAYEVQWPSFLYKLWRYTGIQAGELSNRELVYFSSIVRAHSEKVGRHYQDLRQSRLQNPNWLGEAEFESVYQLLQDLYGIDQTTFDDIIERRIGSAVLDPHSGLEFFFPIKDGKDDTDAIMAKENEIFLSLTPEEQEKVLGKQATYLTRYVLRPEDKKYLELQREKFNRGDDAEPPRRKPGRFKKQLFK
jgi:hypothetical protein